MKPEVRLALDRAADAVRRRTGASFPRVGVVLGSGLAGVSDAVASEVEIPYRAIPGLAGCTAPGHRSRLVAGRLPAATGPDLPVALLCGRHHLYEGHDADSAAFGVRLLGTLGVRKLVITAAVGAIRSDLHAGDFVLLRDHLNLTGTSPLEGAEPGPEPRFPDMTRVWDPELSAALRRAGERTGTELSTGVYAGLRGPQFETPAEIRMLAAMGADVVGMSVVMEAIAARHAGLRIAGITFCSNLAAGISPVPLDAAHVNEAAARAVPRLTALLAAAASEPAFAGQLRCGTIPP